MNKGSLPVEKTSQDQTHRTLKARHIQLISIGGTIGTGLFMQIGTALSIGGPGSLLIAFILWSTVVRFADQFIDKALGVCSGLNLCFGVGLGVPYELTAFNLMLNLRTDKIPVVAVIMFMITCYAALNLFAVRFYGESGFWLAIGKVILIFGLLLFTLVVVVVGGNPVGGLFVEYIYNGSLGRFLGFLSCLIQASFTVSGPELVTITAGEAAYLRHTLPRSFNTITTRLVVFSVLWALSVGVLVPHTDPGLLATVVIRPGAGTLPYVIAMEYLRLGGLAHAVNTLVMLSIFSTGNSYVYVASHTLFGLVLEGRVPAFLAMCNARGVPIYCVYVMILLSLLAFLQLDHTSAALEAQGIPRESLPWHSLWQPFCGYYTFVASFTMMFISGYTVSLLERWNTPTFVFSYALVAVLPAIFLGWELGRGTKLRVPHNVDLFTAEHAEVDAYEGAFPEKLAISSSAGGFRFW
ncbi:general amino acid permease AGP2 [Mycena vulgaris]|nr:general amino acid permease AGP2 [Mycena vulgaris]